MSLIWTHDVTLFSPFFSISKQSKTIEDVRQHKNVLYSILHLHSCIMKTTIKTDHFKSSIIPAWSPQKYKKK